MLWLTGCGSRPPRFYTQVLPAKENLLLEARDLIDLIKKNERIQTQLQTNQKTLMRALTQDIDVGCLLREPLSKLKVYAQGKRADDLLIAEDSENSFGDFATSSRLFFELAPGITFSTKSTALFKKGYASATEEFSSYRLTDISYLKITKEQNSFRLVEDLSERGCGMLWLRSCDRYMLYETHIWNIERLKLMLAGVTIYHKEPLNHTFGGDFLSWQDLDFTANPSYHQALRRDDCLVRED